MDRRLALGASNSADPIVPITVPDPIRHERSSTRRGRRIAHEIHIVVSGSTLHRQKVRTTHRLKTTKKKSFKDFFLNLKLIQTYFSSTTRKKNQSEFHAVHDRIGWSDFCSGSHVRVGSEIHLRRSPSSEQQYRNLRPVKLPI